jgi:hypothetical protein
MFSVQVTQPASPTRIARTEERVKLISAVLLKIVSHDARTACQPTSNGHPGCTHVTCSACDHTASISPMSRASNTR